MRYTGQIASYIPPTAPLELRLAQAVYDEDPVGVTSTGPGLSLGDFTAAVPLVPTGPAVPAWVGTERALSGTCGATCGGNCACPQAGLEFAGVKVNSVLGALAGLAVAYKFGGKLGKHKKLALPAGALVGYFLADKFVK